MVFQNTKVIHKTFGEGIITNHEGNYINVSFGGAIKKYINALAAMRYHIALLAERSLCSGSSFM